jgi:hypothetical protein
VKDDDWLRGPIKIDLEGLANSMVDRELAAEQYMACVRPTIEDPYEIWLTRVETSDGQLLEVKKYIRSDQELTEKHKYAKMFSCGQQLTFQTTSTARSRPARP